MKIRSRIFIGILFVVSVGFFFLLDWMLGEVEPQYRKATEDPLVDSAHVLASIASLHVSNGKFDPNGFRKAFSQLDSHQFEAYIYDFKKTSVDFRVYVTDREGLVVFDSDSGRAEGSDYSEWRDVSRTLKGDYGARTSRDLPGNPNFSVMYVGAPIRVGNDIVGVLSVGKPTLNTNEFTEKSQHQILLVGLLTGLLVIIVSIFVARMITRPIESLTQYALDVRDGRRSSLPQLPSGEVGELGAAFEDMRDALEGKKYVEQFVQTLTHELKSPLSAIKGAAELLKEEPPEERKQKFLSNIENESARIQSVIERLLTLSAVESLKALEDKARHNLKAIVDKVVESVAPECEAKGIKIRSRVSSEIELECDEFLISQALDNLLRNAIEFSGESELIEVSADISEGLIQLRVADNGTGIPNYALGRVFERFYSLQRPANGKKSTGLGLSFVREVASLHLGEISVRNREPRGVLAEIRIPSEASNASA